jgi:2-polyprenyl-3-methyl-5-hydroxy-6-metoxy-1,4-benzoquinol methylase
MVPSGNSNSVYTAETRARQSLGISGQVILDMVERAMDRRQISGPVVVDVGCGAGDLYTVVRSRFAQYIGVDVVRYEDFPEEARFCRFDLDSGQIPLSEGCADAVVAVEVIEHLENPREFARQLVRLVKPGGWVIITTPNQLSFLSLLTLVMKHRFQAFQDVHYPTHLTALLEVDLRRIAGECGLDQVQIEYSLHARLPLMELLYPKWLSRLFPRALSENVLLIGRKANLG